MWIRIWCVIGAPGVRRITDVERVLICCPVADAWRVAARTRRAGRRYSGIQSLAYSFRAIETAGLATRPELLVEVPIIHQR